MEALPSNIIVEEISLDDRSQPSQGSESNQESQPSDQSSQESDAGNSYATDSGHPRFSPKKRLEEADKKDYYCPRCDHYFSRLELQRHFMNHESLEKCTYCQNSVHIYRMRSGTSDIVFHTCSYESPEESPGNISADANQNY